MDPQSARSGLIISLAWTGGMLVGMGLSLSPLLTVGLTIWIVAGLYGYLTRVRRIR